MAFWNRDDESSEWDKYQKSQKRSSRSSDGETPSGLEKLQSYIKPRESDSAEGDEPPKQGLFQSIRSAFQGEEDATPEGPPETCPWCGKEMEKGYLLGARGIYWLPKKPSAFSWGLNNVNLADEGGLLENIYKACWFCKDCRKLTVDTTNLDPPLGVSKAEPSSPDAPQAADPLQDTQQTNEGES